MKKVNKQDTNLNYFCALDYVENKGYDMENGVKFLKSLFGNMLSKEQCKDIFSKWLERK